MRCAYVASRLTEAFVKENHYRYLGVMAALSFHSMYVLMYAMVDSLDHVYNSVKQF
jgi:hypothetical protein